MIHADRVCFESGSKIREKLGSTKESQKVIRDAIAVLQEMGIYAQFLYLSSKHEKGTQDSYVLLVDHESYLLKNQELLGLNIVLDGTVEDFFESVRTSLGDSAPRIYMAKELLERTLTYALYEMRALEDKTQQGGE